MHHLNFIEVYFGMSPDSGDGSIEMMVLVLLVALAVLAGMYLPIGGKSNGTTSTD